jgi:pyridoxal phosphate enzyme (YggS family)
MSHIAERMQAVTARIARAAEAVGRDPAQIRLLAVSKSFGIDDIAMAADAGQRAFGENYVQEAVAKIDAMQSDRNLEWHLIGPLQSNKCAAVAERFSWVHTVDRVKVAARLSASRPSKMTPVNVCIQVNISGEETKSGIDRESLKPLADEIVRMPGLKLRGLMGIAGLGLAREQTRAQFRLLHESYLSLRIAGYEIDTLSMGMSADLEDAIAEGSTMVRIGTAIFGTRDQSRADGTQ